MDPFNPEIEQQWQQNEREISEEEFIHTLNFLYDFQKPARTESSDDKPRHFNANNEGLTDVEDFTGDRDEPEDEFEDLPQLDNDQPSYLSKRKHVSLCRHKLQKRANCQSRSWRSTTDQQPRIMKFEEGDTDHEWAQLREMEKNLERRKKELLGQGVQESDDDDSNYEDWGELQGPEENENGLVKEDDN